MLIKQNYSASFVLRASAFGVWRLKFCNGCAHLFYRQPDLFRDGFGMDVHPPRRICMSKHICEDNKAMCIASKGTLVQAGK